MFGWHWTSLANWELIQTTGGMREYPLGKPEVEKYLGPTGIFVFTEGPLNELDEIGCLLFQALGKKSLQVVALHIAYEDDDVKRPALACDSLALKHTGTLDHGEWAYHVDKPMRVLHGPIPLERVTLHRAYDLTNVLREHVVTAKRALAAS